MTRYTVVWHQEAHDEPAQFWLDAEDREAVQLAANAIDRHLATDASEAGSPVPDRLRQVIIAPLRVLFSVSEADRMVRILDVRRS